MLNLLFLIFYYILIDFFQYDFVLLLFLLRKVLILFSFQGENILLNGNNYINDDIYELMDNRHLLDKQNYDSKIETQ